MKPQLMGVDVDIAIDAYEKHKELAEDNLIYQLKYKSAKEGYNLTSEPVIQEIGYYKVMKNQGSVLFVRVEEKEGADLVRLYATAEATRRESK